MANFSVKASFDGSELVQGFKEVKTEINGLSNAGKSAQKSLGEMLQKKNSTSDYRRQLSLLSREITDLTVNYRRLSEAEQQSEFGVALKQKIDELTAKASEFKDAMLDVQQSINESASDTANWDAFQSLIDITSSSLQTFVGVTGMSEDSVAALTRTIAIMQTTGAAANTVIKVGNALQKTSALMLGVARVQNAAAAAAIRIKTAAEGKGVVVTKAATVAQKAFNVAAKANPYVLLAMAVIAVGAAIYKFTQKTKEAEREQEAYNKRIEEQTERENSRRDVVSTSVGTIIGKYKLLQSQWQQLSSEQEKNRWIADNQSAFNDLGIAINGVNDAQKVFIENSDLVIQALKDQAKAKALAQVYEEAIVAQYKADQKLTDEKQVAKQKYPEGYRPSKAEETAAGLNDSDFLTVTVENSLWDQKVNGKPRLEAKPTDAVDWSGSNKLQTNYLKEHQQAANQAAADVAKIEQAYTDAQKAAAASAQAVKAAGVKLNPTGGGGSTGNPEDIYAEDSLRAAQKEVQTLQDKLNRMSPNDAAFETTKQQLIDAQAKVKELQDKMKSPDAVISPDSLKGLQKEVSTLQNKLNEMSPDDAAFDTTLQQLNEAKAKVKELQDKMREPVTPLTKTEQLVKAYDDAGKQISDIVKQYEIGVIDEVEAKKQIDEINKELQKLGLKPIEIQLKPKVTIADQYSDKRAQIDDVRYQYEIGIVTAESAQETINKINSELRDIGLKPLEINIKGERVLEQVNAWSDALSSLASIFTQVTSAINDENTALGAMCAGLSESEKSWLSWGASSMSTIAQTLPQIASLIVANQAAAMAQGTSSAAGLPFPANIAAIVSIIAMLVGIFASLPKFATGGIISGKNIGDMNLARVNGGEMILNGRQQKNLFAMINQNRLSPSLGSSGEVTFRIQGDTLVGTLNNYYKKRGKV